MIKIWVVDDESDIRRLLKTLLGRAGYDVLGVEDGGSCLKLLEKGEYPDLILLDVMMPGLDGWEVCKKIKRNHAFNSIPICILTAKTAPYDVAMSLNKAHANWHLNKPIEKEKLLDAVSWLTKHKI